MKKNSGLLIIIIALLSIVSYYVKTTYSKLDNISIDEVYDYSDAEFIYINENKASFSDDLINTHSFEQYSELDSLGRCGTALANISLDLMPTEKRESIGMVKPTGWHTIKYDIIKDKYLYNRCHLIGYQLTGENANKKNLITCTRQMNIGVMLTFENKVANYIKETNNHVLYMVTPVFKDDDMLAYGVHMMAYSVEDNGLGINFNVFIYNKQEGIEINYKDGSSKLK